MNSYLQAVHNFHKKFSAIVYKTPTTDIPDELRQFRIQIMREELKELEEAMKEKNLSHLAKEAADVLYTVLGTIETYGLTEKFDAIFEEVHQSNMSKDVTETGKAKKGTSYKEADIEKILKKN